MRIITRRRVKVRVTVRRGDGSVTSHGWAFHRKRDEDGHERKQGESGDDEGVTPKEAQSAAGEPPPPTPDSSHYDTVCDDRDLDVELEEDADYEDAHYEDTKGSGIYENLDKDSERIYEEVGKKGLRVRFEGDNNEEDGDDGSLYSTGAIPKRGSTSTLTEEEEEEEEERGGKEVEEEQEQDDDGQIYETIGEFRQSTEPKDPTRDDRKGETLTRESETYIYDEPRKIEVTVTSKREGDDFEDRKYNSDKPKGKKRGKVEVKFTPWQTEGRGQRTKIINDKCNDGDENLKVEQTTKFSCCDGNGSRHKTGDGDRGEMGSPYELHHRSKIEVTSENMSDGGCDGGDDGDAGGNTTKNKKSSCGHQCVDDDNDDDDLDDDDFGDDESTIYQRGRHRVKKRTLIRVRGVGVDMDKNQDLEAAGRALVKTFTKTIVTFGRGLFTYVSVSHHCYCRTDAPKSSTR
ncbi:hypothetical protein Hamer_G024643 [Homarus americanus]|uniref:Uncharacterized protein n=1 Tax=Homarus americanus TaxID=6706 RepID=A0A8J5JFD9_HOMAM|nr:hypothetical protein Hamer_G024643 [Homarus americanus]